MACYRLSLSARDIQLVFSQRGGQADTDSVPQRTARLARNRARGWENTPTAGAER